MSVEPPTADISCRGKIDRRVPQADLEKPPIAMQLETRKQRSQLL